MSTFNLRVVSSDRIFYDEPAEAIIFTTDDGEMEVMAHHAPAIFAVKNGEIRIKKPDGEWIFAVVTDGIATCANNRMSLTVFSCERPEEIDIARAKKAEERAAERLRQQQSIMEYRLSKAAMARAMERLKEASKNSH